MNILQVSKAEVLGGAERVAWLLFKGFADRGEGSWLGVDEKQSEDERVLCIPPRPWTRVMRPLLSPDAIPRDSKARKLREYATNPGALRRAVLGQDSFAYPGTRHLRELTPTPPDIIHCHNMHGSHFDLRALSTKAEAAPLVVTMHDAWLLTGGCTHPLDCARYLTGCGRCPYRHLHFRASVVDSTAFNHRRKRRILARARVHVVTPCQWLMDKIPGSILEPAVVTRRVIPNGVDTVIFRPGDRAAVREVRKIPEETRVILHASANPTRNISKDFPTMREAAIRVAGRLAERGERLMFLVVGDESAREEIASNGEIVFVPFTNEAAEMARYYAAADVYLQGSVADTFPNTVLEAMACGVPVVATAVGGIPEQIVDGRSGILVSPEAGASLAQDLANALISILSNVPMRDQMQAFALAHVQAHFTLARQIDAHLNLYGELLGDGVRCF